MNKPQNKILEMTFQFNIDRKNTFISNHKLISDKLFKYREKFGGVYLDRKYGKNIFRTYLIENKLKFKTYFNLNNIKSEDYIHPYYYNNYNISTNDIYDIKQIIKKYIRLLKILDIEDLVE